MIVVQSLTNSFGEMVNSANVIMCVPLVYGSAFARAPERSVSVPLDLFDGVVGARRTDHHVLLSEGRVEEESNHQGWA